MADSRPAIFTRAVSSKALTLKIHMYIFHTHIHSYTPTKKTSTHHKPNNHFHLLPKRIEIRKEEREIAASPPPPPTTTTTNNKRRLLSNNIGYMTNNNNNTATATPPPPSTPQPPPPQAADALGRLGSSSRGGRGAVVGWTSCPLCATSSAKRFARGRGLAAHLHAVHAPWQAAVRKPKPVRWTKKQRRQSRIVLQQQQQQEEAPQSVPSTPPAPGGWDPTPAERHAWEARVLEIVQKVEQQQGSRSAPPQVTRTGQVATSYRASLPPFLQAAANGNLAVVKRMTAVTDRAVLLLDTRDRHGSTAESWAAGEGHLPCLQYLVQLRLEMEKGQTNKSATTTAAAATTCTKNESASTVAAPGPKK